MRPIFLLLLMSMSWSVFSQNLTYFPVDFYHNDTLLKNATAGGLDLPQFSAADLNEDELPDLYVYDKLGNVHRGFVNDGLVGEASYTFDYSLTQHFPPLREWALLKDFNQDGAPDIFAYSDIVGVDGIQVHQGYWEDGQLHFLRMEFPAIAVDLLPFSNGTTWERIAPSKFDFPALEDMDGDGDLDILAFGSTSNFVEFYQNQSIEMGYGSDSLIFERADICWGKFLQDANSGAIITSDNPEDCAYNSPNANDVHTIASSLILLNLDGDDDKDVLFTNFEDNEMLWLTNTGMSTEIAHITDVETAFINTEFPAIPPMITVPFLLDLDNDETQDLVISSFIFGRESYEVGWFFKNTQTNENPNFELQQSDFLTETMLDFGSGAHPEFVDYNADGLMDLVVGSAQKWDGNGGRTASLKLFLNTGTSTQPQYELMNNDWLGFGADTLFHSVLAPAFGDLDGDGDLDLLVGEGIGKLNYFENMGGVGNPLNLIFVEDYFQNLNTDIFFGVEITPQTVDVNGDSLPDLLIGEREGNLNYFQNIGTANEPAFDPNPENAPNNAFFGGIDFNFAGSANGNTSPFLFESGDDLKLLVGSENTGTHEFTDIADNLAGDFTEVNGAFAATNREGNFQHPALADLDADGFLEMAIGNMRGGLTFFKTELLASGTVATNQQFSNKEITVSPNPFGDFFTIYFKENTMPFEKMEIYNLSGQLVKTMAVFEKETMISIENLPSGTYFLKGIGLEKTWGQRLIKM